MTHPAQHLSAPQGTGQHLAGQHEHSGPVSYPAAAPAVHVDCEGCTARPQACGDCVVTFLLGSPPEGVDLAPDEQDALEVLAASGLVPALQYRPEASAEVRTMPRNDTP